jgi:PadR family transcriptional regulator PadR
MRLAIRRSPVYIAQPYMAAKSDLKKGSAEVMVLAAIEDAPRHGYDIAREIDSRSSGVLRFHVASLYPMLYRLERRGWITGRWVEKSGQRRRRYYRLTSEGRRMLAAQRTEWRGLLDALSRAAGLGSA